MIDLHLQTKRDEESETREKFEANEETIEIANFDSICFVKVPIQKINTIGTGSSNPHTYKITLIKRTE